MGSPYFLRTQKRSRCFSYFRWVGHNAKIAKASIITTKTEHLLTELGFGRTMLFTVICSKNFSIEQEAYLEQSGKNTEQVKTPETPQSVLPEHTRPVKPKINLKTRFQNLSTRLLGEDGGRMVKRHNGWMSLGVLVLGIVEDMTTLFGPWTKTAAFICGLAVCGFVLLSIFKPKHRRRWAVPCVAAMMMFTMSILVLAGQSAMAAQERGMMGSVSPNIAA